jgi:hypothetical protein
MAHALDTIAQDPNSDVPHTPGRPGVVSGQASEDHIARKHLVSRLGTPPGMDQKDALGGMTGSAPVPPVAIYDEKPIHRTMVLLRSSGKTYKEIAEATEYSEVHVRTVCCQPWARQRMSQLAMDGQMDIQSLLAGEIVKSVETLVEIRDDKKAPPSCRLQAVNQIMDRFLGKPTATVNVNQNKGVDPEADVASLDRQINELRERQMNLAGKGPVRSVSITVTETRSHAD